MSSKNESASVYEAPRPKEISRHAPKEAPDDQHRRYTTLGRGLGTGQKLRFVEGQPDVENW
jgi:hypothetical protein